MADTAKKIPKPKRRKRTLKALLVLMAAGAVVLLAFPWWSAWIAKPIAQAFAPVEIGSIETLSWDRWRIADLQFEQATLRFAAATVEAPSPTAWLASRLRGVRPSDSLSVDGWELDLIPTESAEPSEGALNLPLLFEQIDGVRPILHQHLASATLRNGTIRQNGADLTTIETLTLDPSSLSSHLTLSPLSLPLSIEAQFSDGPRWSLAVEAPRYQSAVDLEIDGRDDRLALDGALDSSGNRVALSALWTAETPGLLPHAATLRADAFQLDERYPFWNLDLPLTLLAEASWENQAYQYRLQTLEAPVDPETPSIQLEGEGSLNALTVRHAAVEFPWLSVESDGPLVLDFSLENPLENAELRATLDLDRLPFLEAQGALNAVLATQTNPEGLPLISAHLNGDGIAFFDSEIQSISARLSVLGSLLTLESLALATTEGSELTASGAYDLGEQTFSEVRIESALRNESERLSALLPFLGWESASLALTASGPLADPQFDGAFSLGRVDLPQLATLDLEAEVSGTLQALSSRLRAQSADEDLTLSFDLARENGDLLASITEFGFSGSESATPLSLPQTATFSLRGEGSDLRLENLVLAQGENQRLAIRQFRFSAEGLESSFDASEFRVDRFNSWLTAKLPPIRIIDLNTKLALTTEASSFTSAGEALWAMNEVDDVEASWRIRQNAENGNLIQLDLLEIGSNTKHIVRGEGAFPVTLDWADGTLTPKLLPKTAFRLGFQSSPHPDFWKSVEALAPVALSRPSIDAQLSGTLEAPEGQLDLQLASLLWKHPEDAAKNLSFSELTTSIKADNRTLRLETFRAKAGGNRIEASASIPLDEFELVDLVNRRQVPDLSQTTGNATLTLDDLSSVSGWMPDFLRRQGRATATVELTPGNITAVADFSGFSTRPLPPLGSLSKLKGRARYDNGRWTLQDASGLAEQSAFTLSGDADFSDPDTPDYQIAFSSSEFPIIRDTGLLLSGDIDLQLESKSSDRPILSGDVRLTKGIMLVEPELLASSTTTTSNRPPYFAVEQAPFRDWGLDVDIEGDRFLRVSNSFFEGTLSADFSLEGTLGAPLLLGRAEAATGRIIFPASSLDLTRGEALITRDRPSEIQVEAAANARLFAYDVNLSAQGSLDDLDLVITTNPALTQVEALLLLTTGATPNTQGNATQSNLAQQSASSIGMFIGKGLFRKLAGNSGGDSSNKLSIEVGRDISRQDKKTINASYQLTETLEIEGEYDERDEYNANLKWTFYRK